MAKLIEEPLSLVSILVSCRGHLLSVDNGRVTADVIARSFKLSAH